MNHSNCIDAPRLEVRLTPRNIKDSFHSAFDTFEIWLVMHPGSGLEPLEQCLEVPTEPMEAIDRLLEIWGHILKISKRST